MCWNTERDEDNFNIQRGIDICTYVTASVGCVETSMNKERWKKVKY